MNTPSSLFHVFVVAVVLSWAQSMHAEEKTAAMPQVVRRAEINPEVPVFIPVHPRIATTVTFPKPIGEPVGTGFIETEQLQNAAAEGKAIGGRGEYAITFVQGENSFTVQPLPKSELLNLNVPYEGSTLVLFFYVVDKPLDAVASLTFFAPGIQAGGASGTPTADTARERALSSIQKRDTRPSSGFKSATPARLEGFLRKLKLVHAAKAGAELEDVAAAMNLKVAVSAAEDPTTKDIPHPVSDSGLYQLVLLRAVRDPSLDAVGFVVLFHNASDKEVVFDLSTLSARCGAALYTAQVADAPASLNAGEVKAGYFAVVGSADGRPGYLLPNNDWRLSVSLVSPRRGEKGGLPSPSKASP